MTRKLQKQASVTNKAVEMEGFHLEINESHNTILRFQSDPPRLNALLRNATANKEQPTSILVTDMITGRKRFQVTINSNYCTEMPNASIDFLKSEPQMEPRLGKGWVGQKILGRGTAGIAALFQYQGPSEELSVPVTEIVVKVLGFAHDRAKIPTCLAKPPSSESSLRPTLPTS